MWEARIRLTRSRTFSVIGLRSIFYFLWFGSKLEAGGKSGMLEVNDEV